MMNPRAVAVEIIGNHQLLVTFNNQEKRIFDVSDYFELPVFRELRNPSIFKSVRIENGTVVWLNDVDLCPDTVYLKSIPVV